MLVSHYEWFINNSQEFLPVYNISRAFLTWILNVTHGENFHTRKNILKTYVRFKIQNGQISIF